jgi:lipopolysaccharide transport system ATP-binding protein
MSRCIEIQELSKQYRLGVSRYYEVSLRERIIELAQIPFRRMPKKEQTLWALRDVSFHVDEGEVLGIVGRNGAGKSTLLKVLSKITYPTSGHVKVKGRVASLLEVGTGFHDELTGRENIYLNGSILGMKKREVDRHFDAIVAFSGIERFIDTPIKRYSSGMRMRLGFAVAAHLEPDVLIVDEVLAVGDAAFQKKCINTMAGLRNSGRTVLFVSHNLAAVENLCTRAIWVDSGKLRMDGGARDVVVAYMGSFGGGQKSGAELVMTDTRLGTGEVRYTKIEYLDADGAPCAVTRSGDGVVLRMHYRANQAVRDPSFGFRLITEMGTLITEANHGLHGIQIPQIYPGDGYIDVQIECLTLVPGRYTLSLWITAPGGHPIYDGDVRTALEVEVADVYRSGRTLDSRLGVVYFPHRWKVNQV